MIAVDTNLLVYAHRRDSPHNDAAFRVLQILASGREMWAIPWPCLHEFLAVVTNTRLFRDPTPMKAAIEQVEVWLDAPRLVLLKESDGYWAVLADVLREGRACGGAVHDARIAALCLEHGVAELWTADRDFARFPGIATFNPLTDERVHESPVAYAVAKRARAAGRQMALAGR